MSLSISKLVDLASSDADVKTGLTANELPSRTANVTKSQYYKSVKNQPRNTQNITQWQTPAGRKGAPYGAVERPKGDLPDGSMDPNAIRSKVDPNSALPYRFPTYGAEDVLFGLPESTSSSHNNVGLIRKAQASYQNRQQILAPREVKTANAIATQLTQNNITKGPPTYDEATGTSHFYKNNNSELNEMYD